MTSTADNTTQRYIANLQTTMESFNRLENEAKNTRLDTINIQDAPQISRNLEILTQSLIWYRNTLIEQLDEILKFLQSDQKRNIGTTLSLIAIQTIEIAQNFLERASEIVKYVKTRLTTFRIQAKVYGNDNYLRNQLAQRSTDRTMADAMLRGRQAAIQERAALRQLRAAGVSTEELRPLYGNYMQQMDASAREAWGRKLRLHQLKNLARSGQWPTVTQTMIQKIRESKNR